MTRDDAWALLCEWTTGDSLRKHALAVEASTRGYAEALGFTLDVHIGNVIASLREQAGPLGLAGPG